MGLTSILPFISLQVLSLGKTWVWLFFVWCRLYVFLGQTHCLPRHVFTSYLLCSSLCTFYCAEDRTLCFSTKGLGSLTRLKILIKSFFFFICCNFIPSLYLSIFSLWRCFPKSTPLLAILTESLRSFSPYIQCSSLRLPLYDTPYEVFKFNVFAIINPSFLVFTIFIICTLPVLTVILYLMSLF